MSTTHTADALGATEHAAKSVREATESTAKRVTTESPEQRVSSTVRR